MVKTLKSFVAQRVMDLIRLRSKTADLDRAKCETYLRHKLMKPGNAQRLLDETTDIAISRLEEAARALEVAPAALLPGWSDQAQASQDLTSMSAPSPEQALRIAFGYFAAVSEGNRKAVIARLQIWMEFQNEADRLLLSEMLLQNSTDENAGIAA